MNRAEKRRKKKPAWKAAQKDRPEQSAETVTVIQEAIDIGVEHHRAGRLPEAKRFYQHVLQVDPNQPVALQLLGLIHHQMGENDSAIDLFTKALGLIPDYADAHNNLGITLHCLGRLDEAVASYRRAINIKPDFLSAWDNLKFSAKALYFSQALEEKLSNFCKEGLKPAARATTNFALFKYYLESFRPQEAEESFSKCMAALPARTYETITISGPDQKSESLTELPDKLVALLFVGRSGTVFLQSLIDNHPEISTLPNMYLRGFFGPGVWNKISAGGWRELPERFADEYEVLFDSTSPKTTPGRPNDGRPNMGWEEGLTAVGENRDEALSLDRKKFCFEALRLMGGLDNIDPRSFLMVIHAAYEKVLGTKTKKHIAFYHIHNPDNFTQLNFLRYAPDARLVVMVREPIQSCESWIRLPFKQNDYTKIVPRILSMFFDIDKIVYRKLESVGVRLEDLKAQPKATMRALCAWMGVHEAPSLYQMTVQGKKWWGNLSYPDYQEGQDVSPFDDAPIKRPVGMVFSEKDQLVLRTLFYPFSVRFGYRKPAQAAFEKDLKKIRPLLDELFDFETVILERSNIDSVQFKRSGNYLLLRAGLLDRWDVLNEFKDYPNMIFPLNVPTE